MVLIVILREKNTNSLNVEGFEQLFMDMQVNVICTVKDFKVTLMSIPRKYKVFIYTRLSMASIVPFKIQV